ncbi:RNA polymerase II-associated protein 3-like [Sarcoptes scabiei]|nr:RNA polymerase II-associated protein 3-like [Sarcoptes scabiei]
MINYQIQSIRKLLISFWLRACCIDSETEFRMDDLKASKENDNVAEQLPPVSPTTSASNGIVKDKDKYTSKKYKKFTELIRRSTSTQLQCSMFCGGRKCKYESGSHWESKDKAIDPLYSHWVLNDILAMSRPNAEMINQFNLIEKFQTANIMTLINLQEPGEHSNCGPPLEESSGFSYEPKIFMDNDSLLMAFDYKLI